MTDRIEWPMSMIRSDYSRRVFANPSIPHTGEAPALGAEAISELEADLNWIKAGCGEAHDPDCAVSVSVHLRSFSDRFLDAALALAKESKRRALRESLQKAGSAK